MSPQLTDLVIYENGVQTNCELTVFPWKPLGVFVNYRAAVDASTRLASEQHVDIWHTTDLKNFVPVARHRAPRSNHVR